MAIQPESIASSQSWFEKLSGSDRGRALHLVCEYSANLASVTQEEWCIFTITFDDKIQTQAFLEAYCQNLQLRKAAPQLLEEARNIMDQLMADPEVTGVEVLVDSQNTTWKPLPHTPLKKAA